jgi:hypothetical protein
MVLTLAHLLLRRSPSARLRRLFRRYSRIYFDFLWVAEQRALAIADSPAAEEAWRVSFALQRALKERQVLRVEALLNDRPDIYLSWTNLDEIIERVDGGWGESDEGNAIKSSDHYAAISRSISNLQSKFDTETLSKGRNELAHDPLYCSARKTLAVKAHEMGKVSLKS